MKMRVLFAIETGPAVALPAGVVFEKYQVEIDSMIGNQFGVRLVASDPSPSVEFPSVQEGKYRVTIKALDSQVNVIGQPILGELEVKNGSSDNPPGAAFYNPPTGFSVLMVPVVTPLPANLP